MQLYLQQLYLKQPPLLPSIPWTYHAFKQAPMKKPTPLHSWGIYSEPWVEKSGWLWVQHSWTATAALLCWVLPRLGSWPCIPSAKGIVLYRHVPEAHLLLGLFPPEWGDTQAHDPNMYTSISSTTCWSRQHLSMNKAAELSVVLLASLPRQCVHCSTWRETLMVQPSPAPGIWGWECASSPPGMLPKFLFFRERWISMPYSMGWALLLPATGMEGSKPNFLL